MVAKGVRHVTATTSPPSPTIPRVAREARYQKHDKAAALAVYDSCGNVRQAAKACGIPRKTLEHWVRTRPSSPSTSPLVAHKCATYGGAVLRATESLVDKLDAVAHRMVDIALAAPPESVKPKEAMICAGIAIQRRADLLAAPARQADDTLAVLANFTDEQVLTLLSAWQETASRSRQQPVVIVDAGSTAGDVIQRDGCQPVTELVHAHTQRMSNPPSCVQGGPVDSAPQLVQRLAPESRSDRQRVQGDPMLGAERVEQRPERQG